jgi:NAD(P)-dependent dehydrogenase (short-subunit alcohol dehydrogenase family)
VSSSGHLLSPVVFDDLQFRFRPYDPTLGYAQSKTANVLFALEASRRWAADRIAVNALNPGAVPTNLQRHTGGRLLSPPELHKTVAQGAATSVLLATSPALAGVAGRYFNDGQEAVVVDRRPDTIAEMTRSVAAYAVDRDNAERLWELSEAAV